MAYNNIVYVMYCTVTLHSKYFQSIQYIKFAPCIAYVMYTFFLETTPLCSALSRFALSLIPRCPGRCSTWLSTPLCSSLSWFALSLIPRCLGHCSTWLSTPLRLVLVTNSIQLYSNWGLSWASLKMKISSSSEKEGTPVFGHWLA